MRISAKSQYGLRAMVYLAKHRDKITPLRTISKTEGISFDYLEKILFRLERASLIKTKKGPGGGYLLARKPQKIKIGEIIKALEGEVPLVKCLSFEKKHLCPRARTCLTKNLWKRIQETINLSLNSITLFDLINK